MGARLSPRRRHLQAAVERHVGEPRRPRLRLPGRHRLLALDQLRKQLLGRRRHRRAATRRPLRPPLLRRRSGVPERHLHAQRRQHLPLGQPRRRWHLPMGRPRPAQRRVLRPRAGGDRSRPRHRWHAGQRHAEAWLGQRRLAHGPGRRRRHGRGRPHRLRRDLRDAPVRLEHRPLDQRRWRLLQHRRRPAGRVRSASTSTSRSTPATRPRCSPRAASATTTAIGSAACGGRARRVRPGR